MWRCQNSTEVGSSAQLSFWLVGPCTCTWTAVSPTQECRVVHSEERLMQQCVYRSSSPYMDTSSYEHVSGTLSYTGCGVIAHLTAARLSLRLQTGPPTL